MEGNYFNFEFDENLREVKLVNSEKRYVNIKKVVECGEKQRLIYFKTI